MSLVGLSHRRQHRIFGKLHRSVSAAGWQDEAIFPGPVLCLLRMSLSNFRQVELDTPSAETGLAC